MYRLSTYLLIAFFCAVGLSPLRAQGKPIHLVYPRSNALLTTTDSVLVLGQVHIPNAQLSINDQFITMAEDGAFIGYVSIDPKKINSDSTFVLSCKVTFTDSVFWLERKVLIPIPLSPLDSTRAMIDSNYLFPNIPIWLRPGDRVRLKCRATPGAKVFYSVINPELGAVVDQGQAMAEGEPDLMDNFGESVFGIGKKIKRGPIPGIYTASYMMREKLNNALLQFTVIKNNDTVHAIAKTRLTAGNVSDMRAIELTAEINNATVDPGRAYYYFFPKGIRSVVDGKIGDQVRLRLSSEHSAWLPEKNISYLSLGTLAPRSFIPVIRVRKDGQKSVIRLFMSEKIPFRIEQTGERQLQLFLYGGISDVDWIRFENENPDVSNVTWSQPEQDVFCLTVDLKDPHHWGYETVYDGTNLIWTIRHKPKTKGLRGLKVCVDPGHSKDIGATGPRGVTERQANVEVAQALKKELESEGASVIMTHADTTVNLSLYDRVAIANQNQCDLFISIHHNAPPDGVNPFSQAFGPSVIYYHPQSKKLAEFIHRAMIKRTKLPDFGVFQGNMAVCRNAQMPSVLVECAFLSLPDQEKMIVDPKFQKRVAGAIKEGIKKVFK